MLPAGAYDRKIEFLQRSVTTDGMGTEIESFVAFVPNRLFAWANVRFGSSAERRLSTEKRIGEGVVSAQAATFRVRSGVRVRTVTEGDAIAWRDARWGIQSIAEAGTRGHEIEFTAVRLGA